MSNDLDMRNLHAAGERARREKEAIQKIDGRTLRKSARTEPISFKVTPQTRQQLHRLALGKGVQYVEVLEEALDLLEKVEKGQL